jgi:hypothetical protein
MDTLGNDIYAQSSMGKQKGYELGGSHHFAQNDEAGLLYGKDSKFNHTINGPVSGDPNITGKSLQRAMNEQDIIHR